MTKRKVINFISSLYGGGAEKFVADLSFYLDPIYDHSIIIYNNKEDLYPYSGKLLDWNFLKSPFRIISIIRIGLAFRKLKKHHSNAVYISHLLIPNLLNCLIGRKSRNIIVIHGKWSFTSEKGKFIDKIINLIFNRADEIICVSNYMSQKINEIHRLKPPVRVIYNGVNVDKIIRMANKESNASNLPDKFLVYVAGLRPVKNHLALLDNLKTWLFDSEYHLVIIGDGILRDEINHKITALDLDSKIIMMGHLKNPFPIMKKARYSLIASKSESFSLVAIESMTLGIPVISTDCGGPREIIASSKEPEVELDYPYIGYGGILIRQNLTDSIGQVVQKIDNDVNEYKFLKESAEDRAKKFNITESVLQYDYLIAEYFYEN